MEKKEKKVERKGWMRTSSASLPMLMQALLVRLPLHAPSRLHWGVRQYQRAIHSRLR